MATDAVNAVISMVEAFLADPFGSLFAGVIMFGVIIALFRYLEMGAGGRDL